jgi:hypothetical protein
MIRSGIRAILSEIFGNESRLSLTPDLTPSEAAIGDSPEIAYHRDGLTSAWINHRVDRTLAMMDRQRAKEEGVCPFLHTLANLIALCR